MNQNVTATKLLRHTCWGLIYFLMAVLIAVTWTVAARTEAHPDGYASIVRMAEGTAYRPFVYRRLTVDAARGLAPVIPAGISNWIDGHWRLRGLVRDKLRWPPKFDRLLLAAVIIVAVSALGFMLCMLWLVRRLYVTSRLLPHVLALAFGVGLLGGRGVHPYMHLWDQYVYDLPQAFLFLLGICTSIAGSWLVIPVFLLAAYNKETSVLLLPAIVLLWPKKREARAAVTAALFVAFVAIQLWIRTHFRGTSGASFFLLGMNLSQIFIFGVWRLPLWGLAIVAVWRNWPHVPRPLRKLIYVPVVLMIAALFMGLIFELRGYMEAYPLVGLIFVQVFLREVGLAGYMRERILFEAAGQRRYDQISV